VKEKKMDANKSHILIVDDDPDMLQLLQFTMQFAGYNVSTTDSGEDAIEKVRHAKYDVMILDLMMPDISGFDVLEALQTTEPRPKVIVHSIIPYIDAKMQCSTLGASRYLVKPTARKVLLDTVAHTIA
jgi:DNA-binding response OmpR family regulator